MTIGTDGPDHISSWGPEGNFIDGRGGDDIIEPPIDTYGFWGVVDGGDGKDTLVVSAHSFECVPNYLGGFTIDFTLHALDFGTSTGINFRSIERVVVEGRNLSSSPTFGNLEVELHTGFHSLIHTYPPLILQTASGNDKIFLYEGRSGSRVATGAGNDLIDFSYFVGNTSRPKGFETTAYGEAGDDTLIGSRRSDKLNGGVGNDIIRAGDGDDLLDGSAGADFLEGGNGRDSYWVESGDTVVETGTDGADDFVWARSSFVLAAGNRVEYLGAADWRLTGPLDLTGNEFANTITGSEGANKLSGGGGDDRLKGFGGQDHLYGGAGIDRLEGGSGGDRYWVETGDIIIEGAEDGAIDMAWASSSFVLTPGAHVEVLATSDWRSTAALDLTGNELDNSITGNNGANILTGRGGVDSLQGLGGRDIFRFENVSDSARGSADQIRDFLAGTDRIDLSAIDAVSGTPANEAFTLIGSTTFSGTAGELRIEAIAGRAHLLADVNGDGLADLQIIVVNTDAIGAGDIVL